MTDSTEVARILNDAADLVAKGWTQGNYAIDKNERNVAINDPPAASFCIHGALMRTTAEYEALNDAKMALRNHLGTDWLIAWNDDPSRTQQQVVDALRGAAVKCQES